MKKLLFLNDTRDHDNWGSNACAESLLAILKQAIPEARIETVLSSWTTRRFRQAPRWLGGKVYWERTRLVDRFSRSFDFLPSVADDFDDVAADWLEGRGGPFVKEFLGKLRGADVVVLNAEGSTYRNNSSAIRCLFALWLARTRFGVPAVFMNGSVTLTVVDPILPAIVRKAFGELSAVAVREPCSLRNVHAFVPGKPVELVPDSVFHVDEEFAKRAARNGNALEEQLKGKEYFCFGLSMLLPMIPGYARHGIRRTSLFALMTVLKSICPNSVILARDGMDQELCRALARETGSFVFGPEHTYSDLLSLLRGAQFMISGRYHHLILAVVGGCPPIALRTTSHKVDGLCELLSGEIGYAFDATDLWPHVNAIRDLAQSYVDQRREKQERLEVLAVALRRRASRLGQIATEAIGSRR